MLIFFLSFFCLFLVVLRKAWTLSDIKPNQKETEKIPLKHDNIFRLILRTLKNTRKNTNLWKKNKYSKEYPHIEKKNQQVYLHQLLELTFHTRKRKSNSNISFYQNTYVLSAEIIAHNDGHLESTINTSKKC